MRIATHNVNSIRTRVGRVVDWLERSKTDVLAMQEIKCKPEQFPLDVFEEAGYEVVAHGLNQWNGVAILSKVGLDDVVTNFAGVFPIEEPRYVIVVMLDEPQGTAETFGFRTAGWNVAPVVSKTISRIAPMLGIRPDKKRDANMAEVLPYLIFAFPIALIWWVLRGSNPRPTPCKGAALPAELSTRSQLVAR